MDVNGDNEAVIDFEGLNTLVKAENVDIYQVLDDPSCQLAVRMNIASVRACLRKFPKEILKISLSSPESDSTVRIKSALSMFQVSDVYLINELSRDSNTYHMFDNITESSDDVPLLKRRLFVLGILLENGHYHPLFDINTSLMLSLLNHIHIFPVFYFISSMLDLDMTIIYDYFDSIDCSTQILSMLDKSDDQADRLLEILRKFILNVSKNSKTVKLCSTHKFFNAIFKYVTSPNGKLSYSACSILNSIMEKQESLPMKSKPEIISVSSFVKDNISVFEGIAIGDPIFGPASLEALMLIVNNLNDLSDTVTRIATTYISRITSDDTNTFQYTPLIIIVQYLITYPDKLIKFFYDSKLKDYIIHSVTKRNTDFHLYTGCFAEIAQTIENSCPIIDPEWVSFIKGPLKEYILTTVSEPIKIVERPNKPRLKDMEEYIIERAKQIFGDDFIVTK